MLSPATPRPCASCGARPPYATFQANRRQCDRCRAFFQAGWFQRKKTQKRFKARRAAYMRSWRQANRDHSNNLCAALPTGERPPRRNDGRYLPVLPRHLLNLWRVCRGERPPRKRRREGVPRSGMEQDRKAWVDLLDVREGGETA